MNREIKFRGKCIATNKWIYGCVCKTMGDGYAIMPDSNYATWVGKPRSNEGQAIGRWYQVYSESVGQYTGLKDKNGKEIYEGDHVKTNSGDISEVKFGESEECFIGWYVKNENINWPLGSSDSLCTENKMIEVVGNIHDNPELVTLNPQ